MSVLAGRPRDVVAVNVVGAGVAGLYAAYALARSGRARVLVVERRPRVGGLVETVRVNGRSYELGPSHHLEGHARLRELLRFAGARETPFKSPSAVVADGVAVEVAAAEDELLAGCAPDSTLEACAAGAGRPPAATSLPWWDELKGFRARDAARTADEGAAFTAAEGYQKAFELVRAALEKSGVRFERRNVVDFSTFECEDGGRLPAADYAVLAVPPAALGAAAPGRPGSLGGKMSIRLFAFFEGANECREALYEALKDRHVVSSSGLFRWAVVISPNAWLLSYVDDNRARALAEALKRGGEEVLASFVSHVERYHDLLVTEDALKGVELRCREDYEGVAYHTRDDSAPGTTFARGVALAGEAYGPPGSRAWMEAACESAEAAVDQIAYWRRESPPRPPVGYY